LIDAGIARQVMSRVRLAPYLPLAQLLERGCDGCPSREDKYAPGLWHWIDFHQVEACAVASPATGFLLFRCLRTLERNVIMLLSEDEVYYRRVLTRAGTCALFGHVPDAEARRQHPSSTLPYERTRTVLWAFAKTLVAPSPPPHPPPHRRGKPTCVTAHRDPVRLTWRHEAVANAWQMQGHVAALLRSAADRPRDRGWTKSRHSARRRRA